MAYAGQSLARLLVHSVFCALSGRGLGAFANPGLKTRLREAYVAATKCGRAVAQRRRPGLNCIAASRFGPSPPNVQSPVTTQLSKKLTSRGSSCASCISGCILGFFWLYQSPAGFRVARKTAYEEHWGKPLLTMTRCPVPLPCRHSRL